jgi:hypothetical protein
MPDKLPQKGERVKSQDDGSVASEEFLWIDLHVVEGRLEKRCRSGYHGHQVLRRGLGEDGILDIILTFIRSREIRDVRLGASEHFLASHH